LEVVPTIFHVAVLVSVLHLQGLLHLRHDRLEQAGVAAQGIVVIGAEDGAVGNPDAALAGLAGKDGEHVGAKSGDSVLYRLLGAAAQRDHGDHRSHSDDDAQHGEYRSQHIGPDRLERHRNGLAQQHRSRASLCCGRTRRSAAACPERRRRQLPG
jgi:hypothetical protein